MVYSADSEKKVSPTRVFQTFPLDIVNVISTFLDVASLIEWAKASRSSHTLVNRALLHRALSSPNLKPLIEHCSAVLAPTTTRLAERSDETTCAVLTRATQIVSSSPETTVPLITTLFCARLPPEPNFHSTFRQLIEEEDGEAGLYTDEEISEIIATPSMAYHVLIMQSEQEVRAARRLRENEIDWQLLRVRRTLAWACALFSSRVSHEGVVERLSVQYTLTQEDVDGIALLPEDDRARHAATQEMITSAIRTTDLGVSEEAVLMAARNGNLTTVVLDLVDRFVDTDSGSVECEDEMNVGDEEEEGVDGQGGPRWRKPDRLRNSKILTRKLGAQVLRFPAGLESRARRKLHKMLEGMVFHQSFDLHSETGELVMYKHPHQQHSREQNGIIPKNYFFASSEETRSHHIQPSRTLSGRELDTGDMIKRIMFISKVPFKITPEEYYGYSES
ncbi:hypothetical protein BJ742DRAFT_913837 [Cladochytrium replicatum]|nr:hypothetical protein BJ742DRAFT_913837 [Cladochytrium replicatum]